MHQARERQAKYAQGKARADSFQLGQRVLLSSKNIKLRSDGTLKLQPKWLGTFLLVRMVGTQAAELELPGTMRMHDVFDVSLLKPFYAQPGEVANPHGVDVDGDQKFDVEFIKDHRGSGPSGTKSTLSAGRGTPLSMTAGSLQQLYKMPLLQ